MNKPRCTLTIAAFLALVFISCESKTADYLDYYRVANKAYEAMLTGDYQRAVDLYQQAFYIKLPPAASHQNDYARAALCQIYNGKLDAAIDLLRKAMRRGYTLEAFKENEEFVKLLKTRQGQALVNEFDSHRSDFAAGFDHELIEKIADMKMLDQQYRTRLQLEIQDSTLADSLKKSGIYFGGQVDYKQFPRMTKAARESMAVLQRENDRQNLAEMEKIISEYGYPGYGLIGSNEAAAILLHVQDIDNDPEAFIAKNDILGEVRRGSISPSLVASIVDRISMHRNGVSKYHSGINLRANAASIDEAAVDTLRAQIGLYSMAVKKILDAQYMERFKSSQK